MVTQSPSSSSLRLPPCWRDFEIYRIVKVDRCSTRNAARILKLSQTRICQIMTRVGEYLGELLLASDSEENRRRDLLVAEQIAAEQVDYLNRQALLAFRRSQPKILTLPEDGSEDGAPQTSHGPGDVRYLLAAAKLSLYQTKLPTPKLAYLNPEPDDMPDDGRVDECDALNEELSDKFAAIEEELAINPQAGFDSPPDEDCSEETAAGPVRTTEPRSAQSATLDLDSTCVQGVSPQLLTKLSATAPVQPAPVQPGSQRRPAKPVLSVSKQQARRAFFEQ